MAEHSTSPLTPAEQRTRALIDAGLALVITMLLWPFPIARAMLAPVWNVLLVLLTWQIVSILYHVICVRVWRRTGAMYLLGYSLEGAGSPVAAEDGVPVERRAIRWAVIAGLLVVATAIWPGAASLAENGSGVELRS